MLVAKEFFLRGFAGGFLRLFVASCRVVFGVCFIAAGRLRGKVRENGFLRPVLVCEITRVRKYAGRRF